jgi:hypothetical protein
VPWLCAYTGTRVNAIPQLSGWDVPRDTIVRIEDRRAVEVPFYFIRVTPEAGRVKTRRFREVPCTTTSSSRVSSTWSVGAARDRYSTRPNARKRGFGAEPHLCPRGGEPGETIIDLRFLSDILLRYIQQHATNVELICKLQNETKNIKCKYSLQFTVLWR